MLAAGRCDAITVGTEAWYALNQSGSLPNSGSVNTKQRAIEIAEEILAKRDRQRLEPGCDAIVNEVVAKLTQELKDKYMPSPHPPSAVRMFQKNP